MTFTDAAQLVLKMEGKPTTCKKIAETAVRLDLLSLVGAAPAETMQTRLSDMIRRRGASCPFVEVKSGTFALREWRGAPPGPDTALAARLRAERTDAEEAAPKAAAASGAKAGARPAGASSRAPGTSKRSRSRRTTTRREAPPGRTAATRKTEAVKMGSESEDTTTPAESVAAAAPAGSGPRLEGAAGTGEPAEGAGAVEGGAASDGRKRRRRRRGKKGAAGVAPAPETTSKAPPDDVRQLVLPAPGIPSPAPRRPEPGRDRPAPVASAEAIVAALRGPRGRGGARADEMLREWSSRGAVEARIPLPALQAALALNDASRRLGGAVQSLSAGRWATIEAASGDEVAACERRTEAAVSQQAAAVRRALLRRLLEMPLPAFHQAAIALLAAEGFREIGPLEPPAQAPAGAPRGVADVLLLQARAPFGPAEIAAMVLVVRSAPGRPVPADHLALLRGRLPAIGACQGVIVTTGRVGEQAHRDLVPPNAVPLLAIEQDDLVMRFVRHGIGVHTRAVDVPVLDPEAFGIQAPSPPGPER